jgi:glutamate-1-semialdehyde 2,1-aminomutase
MSYDKSRALLARARKSLTGGVSSPFRAAFPVPLYFAAGRGARLRDVDGNEYVDYLLGWGPAILGHAHPAVVAAVERAAARPHIYGEEHECEIAVAEAIQRLVPCAERVAFTSSGSEALQLAFRLARAHTGRNLILRCEGHYHGWMDSALVGYRGAPAEAGPLESPRPVLGSKGQAPNSAENVVVAPWNRLDILDRILHRHRLQVAAVVMEPVLCNSGCILPEPGYLEGVRGLCDAAGCLLVFDEVITGFRMGTGGAQEHYGVTPDLATFGKAVGGGLPLSVVAGRAEILEQMCGGGVSFGGTFNGNPISLAAADATLTELARDGGAALAHANRVGESLIAGIRNLASRRSLPLLVSGFGTAFALHFTRRTSLGHYRDTLDDDKEMLGRFLRLALDRGVHIVPDGRMYTSCAHGDAEARDTLAAFDGAFAALGPTPAG